MTKECDTNKVAWDRIKVTGVDREDGGAGIRSGTGQNGHNASHHGRQPTNKRVSEEDRR